MDIPTLSHDSFQELLRYARHLSEMGRERPRRESVWEAFCGLATTPPPQAIVLRDAALAAGMVSPGEAARAEDRADRVLTLLQKASGDGS